MENKLKNMLRLFLDSIREYEHESGKGIYTDERPSKEFVDIWIESDDAFDYKEILALSESKGTVVKCEHPRSERVYIGTNMLRCNLCGHEFR